MTSVPYEHCGTMASSNTWIRSESKTKELMDVKDLQVNTDNDIGNDDNDDK